ncbi:hypothetical protein HanIR_Chr12g0582801 [Helianthus annuus]|nr:hypothetical protein HanIR_Chr12g0582801 [Helianthus annuus]
MRIFKPGSGSYVRHNFRVRVGLKFSGSGRIEPANTTRLAPLYTYMKRFKPNMPRPSYKRTSISTRIPILQ